jgi:hypothetical protein
VLKKVWENLPMSSRGFFDDLAELDMSRYVEEYDAYVMNRRQKTPRSDTTAQIIKERSSMPVNPALNSEKLRMFSSSPGQAFGPN